MIQQVSLSRSDQINNLPIFLIKYPNSAISLGGRYDNQIPEEIDLQSDEVTITKTTLGSVLEGQGGYEIVTGNEWLTDYANSVDIYLNSIKVLKDSGENITEDTLLVLNEDEIIFVTNDAKKIIDFFKEHGEPFRESTDDESYSYIYDFDSIPENFGANDENDNSNKLAVFTSELALETFDKNNNTTLGKIYLRKEYEKNWESVDESRGHFK